MSAAGLAAPHAAKGASAAARAALFVALALFVAILLPLFALIGQRAAEQAPPAGAVGEIPPVYVPVYHAAAEAYGVPWLLLAAIHKQETDFSRLRVRGAAGDAVSSGWNGCGAAGPMQFGIVGVAPYRGTAPSCGALTGTGAGNIWRRYRDAHRRLPRRARPNDYPQMRSQLRGCARVPARHGCVYDDVDAIAAAAAYLHDLGAGPVLDRRAWRAAQRYNGAAAYADAVMSSARRWEAMAVDDFALTDAPTVPGVRARLGRDGRARAPRHAPSEVKRAIAAANAISDRPYLLRHYPTHLNNPTYDCSSSTSHVLWGARRFGTAPWVSAQLMRYGAAGPGRWITVYANQGHVFLVVAGLRFDTARYDRGPNAGESGPRWRLGPRPMTNFVVRHPRGL
jgi:hypothetical protein